jgi:hypothetical protein
MSERFGSRLLIALIIAMSVPGLGAAKKQADDQEVRQLLEKVLSLSDIRAADSPPFRIQARVESAALQSGRAGSVGTWMLTWQSPTQWREEVGFPGFRQVRVASGGKIWTYRSTPYEPLRVYQLSQVMDFRALWILRTGQVVTALREKKHNGISVQCVEVRGEVGPWRDLCSDSMTALPAWVEPGSRTALTLPSAEYSDYKSWGKEQFPRSIRAYEHAHLILAVRLDVEPVSAADQSQFAPPPQATEWDWCDNAEPSQPISTVPPHYPDAERFGHREGLVSVYAIIHTDGTLGDLAVVRSAGPDFDGATLASVRQWHLRPAMCGSKPIVTETVIDVAYTLR